MFESLKVDLHIHSNLSDGELSPNQIFEISQKRGLNVISITDHDCIDGSILINSSDKLKVIIGAEMSTIYKDNNVHVLGYFNNREDAIEFNKIIKNLQMNRIERAKNVIELLKVKKNIEIDINNLMFSKSINRKNIADEIIKKYPFMKKKEVFKLISKGGECYIPSSKIPTAKMVEYLHNHNALAIIAHPVLVKDFEIAEFIAMGIDGLEAIYPQNTKKDTIRLLSLCKDNNLLITGGSDFHDFEDQKHGIIGDFFAYGNQIKEFLEKIGVK